MMFLNVSICEEVKIQSKCRWYDVSMLISMNEHAIAQFHRNQWNLQWENYKKCIADINVIFAQRFHLFKKSVRMHNDFQKIESKLAIYIKIECIEFNVYLHLKNISRVNSLWCNCKWNHQIIKHVLMHCLNWTHLQSIMLWNINFMNYQIIIAITKSFKIIARMLIKMKFLKQFKMTRALIF